MRYCILNLRSQLSVHSSPTRHAVSSLLLTAAVQKWYHVVFFYLAASHLKPQVTLERVVYLCFDTSGRHAGKFERFRCCPTPYVAVGEIPATGGIDIPGIFFVFHT